MRIVTPETRLPLTDFALQPKPTLRQALGDKRIMAVLLMSFASGMPFNLSGSGFAFQAWLASAGVDLKYHRAFLARKPAL